MHWGNRNAVHETVKIGDNLQIGEYNVIEEGVVIGNNVKIEHHTFIKKGTVIGDDVVIDTFVRTGGPGSVIGNRCNIKIGTVLSPDTIVGDDCFFGPKCMVLHAAPDGTHSPTKIGSNVYIGACALVGPGLVIEDGARLGAYSFATKNMLAGCVYVGSPARCIKKPPEAAANDVGAGI